MNIDYFALISMGFIVFPVVIYAVIALIFRSL